MLDYYQALQQLLNHLPRQKKTENRPLTQANTLVLARQITANYDSPPFDNSAMDGYALGGDISGRMSWQIVDRIAAGQTLDARELKTGEAARIFTGAPTPPGTTTVIEQEHTDVQGTTLRLAKSAEPARNIRRRGEEFKRGDLLIESNQRLTPAMIALLASQGCAEVTVFSPLKIGVLSTGNELINPGHPLENGKIYDSNRFLIVSWLKQSPNEIIDGGILPDDPLQIESALKQMSKNVDLIVTSGGVSVGEEDHLKQVIEKLGTLTHWKLAIKPGKPFAWGAIGNCTVFMLPGNPVSSFVTFQQLVCPALGALMGMPAAESMPKPLYAKALFEKRRKQDRREFVRVALQRGGEGNSLEGLYAKLLPHQGSAMLSSCIKAQALAEIPPQTEIRENDLIKIYPLNYKL